MDILPNPHDNIIGKYIKVNPVKKTQHIELAFVVKDFVLDLGAEEALRRQPYSKGFKTPKCNIAINQTPLKVTFSQTSQFSDNTVELQPKMVSIW